MHRALLPLILLLATAVSVRAQTNPSGGALTGQRYRVIVSTDIGGSDPDDQQSMTHYLVYSDVFDTEGLISSPPGGGRKSHIDEAIDAYETDYANLKTYSSTYPTPSYLRSISKQGATSAQSGSTPPSSISSGAQHLIDRAKSGDSRPLHVLVWGSITDVAQAVHKDPSIKSKLRIHSIGSWNTGQDPKARDYLVNNHGSSLWMIESDVTFRGMYQGGNQSGDLGNSTFVSQHVKGHGALGDYFYSKKTSIKMGDTPSVLYLMRGNPDSPTSEHWGGKFWRKTSVGSTFWTDISDQSGVSDDQAKATVNKWREKYLRDWQARMDRCTKPSGGGGGGNAPPTANDQNVNVPHDTSVPVTLSYSDSDGPGPYSFSILQGPSKGGLSGSGQNRTYTPNTGASGSDQFTWRVNDGLVNSNTATVTLSIASPPGGGGGGSGSMPGYVSNSSPASYPWDTLSVGTTQYGDRTYTFTYVPAIVDGLDLLRTDNDDKTSTGPSFISFDVNQNAIVYVAYDDRFTSLPSWMAGYTDTGEDLVSGGGTFRLWKTEVPPGTVTLGGNTDSGSSANSMYSVIVTPGGSGTGSGSGSGSGGGSGGSGGGGPAPASGSGSGGSGNCGATGAEALLVLGLLALLRRHRTR